MYKELARRLVWVAIAVVVILIFRSFTPEEFVFKGETMGTTYSITAYGSRSLSYEDVQVAIKRRLNTLNDIFSTYDPKSSISKFNDATVGEKIWMPHMFKYVFQCASRLFEESGGLWDPTVFPLFELWGFFDERQLNIPSQAEINTVLTNVGFQHISLLSDGYFIKQRPIRLDLSSIAKGFGVDHIVELLLELGMTSFLVEIGGEVRVSKVRPNGELWRIGISHPEADNRDSFLNVMSVSDKAVATSGDYRNYFEYKGKRYSHILNPLTGRPIQTDLKSVTILAHNCMIADGLATLGMLLGETEMDRFLNKFYPQSDAFYY